ncbi:MAG TPA: AEC family transporter [Burkholderiaceae bacterium]|nr:AEC family transporter [Burkholderiaceae bacterium]
MLAILLVTFPFFALVLCGYLAVRRGLLPTLAIPALNTFVLFFALPCLLYRFGATTPIERSLDPGVLSVYLLCALVLVGLTVWLTLSRRIRWKDAAFGALVAAFPNTGFMGVPLLVKLLGPQAAGPAIATILVDLVVTSSTCIALSQLDSADEHGVRHAAGNALRGMLINPMPWSILLGALSSASGVLPPAPVMQTISLLADAASPTALFTIGAVLARSQMAHGEATAPLEYLPVVATKLLLHPLLVLVAGGLAIRFGLPLDAFALSVIVLVAALPSASNVVILAEKFAADSGRIARIILVSTALAFLTFSGAAALFI